MNTIDKLFIIGNGFDRWQGLPTSYKSFREYYEKHKFEVCKQLDIQPIKMSSSKGKTFTITPFDLIYCGLDCEIGFDGETDDEFEVAALDVNYWNEIEGNLGELDDFTINGYYGKEDDDLEDMKKDLDDAVILIKKCLYNWIRSIEIKRSYPKYDFSNALFFNFNYTETLQKRFGVSSELDYHIHGCRDLEASLMFGHDSFSEEPTEAFDIFGGRFRGLYHIQNTLSQTDKKASDRIKAFKEWLSSKNISLANVKEVYVLGHSLGKVDYKYFKFFAKTLSKKTVWKFSFFSPEDEKRIMRFVKKEKIKSYALNKGIDTLLQPFEVSGYKE